MKEKYIDWVTIRIPKSHYEQIQDFMRRKIIKGVTSPSEHIRGVIEEDLKLLAKTGGKR